MLTFFSGTRCLASSVGTANREVHRLNPLQKTTTFVYDVLGRLDYSLDQLAHKRDFGYDATSHLTTEAWIASDGTTVNNLFTFTYDAVGNQLTDANNAGTYTMIYDALHRVTHVDEPFRVGLTFTYDAVGQRVLVQDSFGVVSTSVYDVRSQLTSRLYSDGTNHTRIDQEYDIEGRKSAIERYSNLAGTALVASTAYAFDAAGRLIDLDHDDISHYTYTYDAHSRMTSESFNGTARTYSYDNTDQLTNDSTTSYTYDANGNRTMSGYSTGSNNRLTSDGTWNFTYDDEGNQSTKTLLNGSQTWEYSYDHRNHLVGAELVRTADDVVIARATYTYDAFSNRLSMTNDQDGDIGPSLPPITTNFTLDGWNPEKPAPIGNENWDVYADLNDENERSVQYVRGDVVDELFAQIADGDTSWYLTDHLGSTRDYVDNAGDVVAHTDYDGFGNATNALETRYQWMGREADRWTGQQYNRARYFDGQTGR